MNTILKDKLVKSDVSKIFLITVSLFLFVLILKVYFQLNDYKVSWFAQNFYPYFGISNTMQNLFYHPWVLFIHFFIEADLRDVISNGLWLFFFGFILEDMYAKNTVFIFYIISGIVSGLIIWICICINPNLLPKQYYLGMQAPIMAIATATVASNPKRKIIPIISGGIPIYIIAIIYLILNISNCVYYGIAPLIGLFSCIILGIFFHLGFDNQILKWQTYWVDKTNTKNNNLKNYETTTNFTTLEKSNYTTDEILDKINAKGINSLTKNEKLWLQNAKNNE